MKKVVVCLLALLLGVALPVALSTCFAQVNSYPLVVSGAAPQALAAAISLELSPVAALRKSTALPAAVATSGSASDLSTGTLPAGRLPNPSASTLGGIQSAAAVSHQFVNSISTAGVPGLSQPASTDISSPLGSIPYLLSVTLNASENTDKISCSGVTTEQVFATTYPIPANYLGATGKGLRFEYMFQVTSSATADTLLGKVRLQKAGPTNIYVYTMAAATTPGNNATSSPFNARYDLFASGSPSASASIYVGGSFGLVSAPFGARSTVSNPVTMDTTAQQIVQATLTCTSGTAGNTLSLMGLKVWAPPRTG